MPRGQRVAPGVYGERADWLTEHNFKAIDCHHDCGLKVVVESNEVHLCVGDVLDKGVWFRPFRWPGGRAVMVYVMPKAEFLERYERLGRLVKVRGQEEVG